MREIGGEGEEQWQQQKAHREGGGKERGEPVLLPAELQKGSSVGCAVTKCQVLHI